MRRIFLENTNGLSDFLCQTKLLTRVMKTNTATPSENHPGKSHCCSHAASAKLIYASPVRQVVANFDATPAT